MLKWGTPPTFDFEIKDHVDVGEGIAGIDFGAGSKISGARSVSGWAAPPPPRVRTGCGARADGAVSSSFFCLFVAA